MAVIQLFGQFFSLPQKSYSSQRLVNWIPTPTEAGKGTMMFLTSPGQVQQFTATPNSGTGCRGNYRASVGPAPDYDGLLYSVIGDSLFRTGTDKVAWFVGTIGANQNPVRMVDNGEYLFIADGNALYRSLLSADNASLELIEVGLPNVPGGVEVIRPDQLEFVEQRLIINSTNSNQWFYSDAGTYDFGADNFYSAEQSADKINGIRSIAGNIWIWGNRSVEIWRGTGLERGPFAWVGGSGSQIGCKSTKSIAAVNDMVFWLGASDVGENAVYMGQGQTISRVSNSAIDIAIAGLVEQEYAEGYCYSTGGDVFYILTFRTSKRTFVYEATSQMWHERSRWNLSTGEHEAWEPIHCAFFNGVYYFGTLSSNVLCSLSDSVYADYDGNPIVRDAFSPVAYAGGALVYFDEIALDMETGATPLLVGYGSDPYIYLAISKDGGYTYGPNVGRGFGPQGQYRRTVRWTNMGAARNAVFRFRTSVPVPCAVYSGELITQTGGRT